jgi:hypothetical protein
VPVASPLWRAGDRLAQAAGYSGWCADEARRNGINVAKLPGLFEARRLMRAAKKGRGYP